MKIVLLGAPASGKGTLATSLSPLLGVPHISTGQMLRDCVAEQTPIGKLVQDRMKTGELISDEIVMQLVKERIAKSDCANGFVFDGFPRTIAQAKALDAITTLDLIFTIRISSQILIERVKGRRTCPKCGEIYHISWFKQTACKKCGTTLIEREDQKPEIFAERLRVFETQTAPLIDYYQATGKLVWIESKETAEETFAQVKTFLLEKRHDS